MDPITLIFDALEAGDAPDVGVLSVMPDDYRDMYDEFITALSGKLADAGAVQMLEQYLAQPEVWEGPMTEAMLEAGVDRDPEVIDLAQSFLEVVDVRRAKRGAFTVDFEGGELGLEEDAISGAFDGMEEDLSTDFSADADDGMADLADVEDNP